MKKFLKENWVEIMCWFVSFIGLNLVIKLGNDESLPLIVGIVWSAVGATLIVTIITRIEAKSIK